MARRPTMPATSGPRSSAFGKPPSAVRPRHRPMRLSLRSVAKRYHDRPEISIVPVEAPLSHHPPGPEFEHGPHAWSCLGHGSFLAEKHMRAAAVLDLASVSDFPAFHTLAEQALT